MKIKYIFFLAFVGIVSVNIIGCLNVETKEYSYKLKNDKSGSGKIKYINIMRSDDSSTTIEADYQDLITSYVKGNKPEDEMTGVKNVKKRLFEEDNYLCGELTFDFDDITTLKFFNYNGKVWAYSLSANSSGLFGGSETYFSSNGTFGGDDMPVIFWDSKEKVFEFKTVFSQENKKNTGLLDMWKQKGE